MAQRSVGADVTLAGYDPDPLRILSRAALFVSASTHEGFGNALIEAMACGVPVVATDAPHGPREILDGGRFGTLVPVGDAPALASAMAAALDRATDTGALQARARRYTVEAAADAFSRALATAGLTFAPQPHLQPARATP
jgi:glycosyltransferase involved in cell wall biosynthesis